MKPFLKVSRLLHGRSIHTYGWKAKFNAVFWAKSLLMDNIPLLIFVPTSVHKHNAPLCWASQLRPQAFTYAKDPMRAETLTFSGTLLTAPSWRRLFYRSSGFSRFLFTQKRPAKVSGWTASFSMHRPEYTFGKYAPRLKDVKKESRSCFVCGHFIHGRRLNPSPFILPEAVWLVWDYTGSGTSRAIHLLRKKF